MPVQDLPHVARDTISLGETTKETGSHRVNSLQSVPLLAQLSTSIVPSQWLDPRSLTASRLRCPCFPEPTLTHINTALPGSAGAGSDSE